LQQDSQKTQVESTRLFEKEIVRQILTKQATTPQLRSPNGTMSMRPLSAQIGSKKTSSRPTSAYPLSGFNSSPPGMNSVKGQPAAVNPLYDYYLLGQKEFPVIEPNHPSPYLELKNSLVDIIVSRRLFKNEDIERLFHLAIEHNKHLSHERIIEVCMEIKSELDANM